MKVPEWVVDQIRRIGCDMMRHPEKFTGGLQINAVEGGITNMNIEISFRPDKEQPATK